MKSKQGFSTVESTQLFYIKYFAGLLQRVPLQTLKHHIVCYVPVWFIHRNVKHLFTFSGCCNLACTLEQWMGWFQLKAIMELIVKMISGLLLATQTKKTPTSNHSTLKCILLFASIIACFGYWHLDCSKHQFYLEKMPEGLNVYFVKIILWYKTDLFHSYSDNGRIFLDPR